MNRLYIYIVFIFCAAVVSLELLLRLFGFYPFPHHDPIEAEILIQKNYEKFRCDHEEIGLIPCEGSRSVPISEGYYYHATHLSDGSRYCGFKSTGVNKKLLITGDSNIHGDGVDDTSHVGYKIQSNLDDFQVINRSIPGSGNGSQLLVLKNSLKNYKPDIVIATYASYHNQRNIFGRGIRKAFIIPESRINNFRFPSARIKNDTLTIDLETYHYTAMPLSNYLSIFEGMNLVMETIEYKYRNADDVTKKIWEDYIGLCKANGIMLCILIQSEDRKTKEMISFFSELEVPIINVYFHNDSLTLYPIDGHPNGKGHSYMANIILDSLQNFNWISN